MDLLNRVEQMVEWPENAPSVRITVSTLNALQDARYRAYLTSMRDWFAAETGANMEEMDEWSDADLSANIPALNLGVIWAQNMGALIRVEERVPENEGKGRGWETIPIPAEWKEPAAYMDTVPAALIYAWNEAAELANPSLWNAGDDDESKKNAADSGSG